MQILFISSWFPYPANNGSKLRIHNLLRGLAEHHKITLLTFTEQPGADPNVPALRSLCHEVHVIPWKTIKPQKQHTYSGFFSLAPRSVVSNFSPEMAQFIERSLTARDYDLVIASEWMMASYGRYFRNLPALLDELQVGVQYAQFYGTTSFWPRLRYGLTWTKHRNYLKRQLRYFRVCTVASDTEKELLSCVVPDYQNIEVIPNCIRLADYRNVHQNAQPNTLIFTGSFHHPPNHEAMAWYLSEVNPRIQEQVPDVHLTITGDHAGLLLPPADNVTLSGFVKDVRPLIASAWVSLVPMHAGGGTRLKILEAMALGTPVVATTKGAEGLDAQHGEHLLIANTPEAFANAILRLLREPKLRQHLATNAYQLVREEYDWAATLPRFLDLVERVAQL